MECSPQELLRKAKRKTKQYQEIALFKIIDPVIKEFTASGLDATYIKDFLEQESNIIVSINAIKKHIDVKGYELNKEKIISSFQRSKPHKSSPDTDALQEPTPSQHTT